ncbi:MAG: YceI family protein [Polyangiales bacterium]
MMKNARRASAIVVMCLSVPAIGLADSETFVVRDDGKSHVTFVSDAPLETTTGTSSKVTGTVTVDPADITKTTGSFDVPVVSLRTGKDLRDEHLQGDGWLDAKRHPKIHFEITEVVLGKKASKELKKNKDTKVEVKGMFTVHGISKPVTAKGTVHWAETALLIKAQFNVKLEDHQISVPSIVRLKVANDIAVSVDLRGVPEQP